MMSFRAVTPLPVDSNRVLTVGVGDFNQDRRPDLVLVEASQIGTTDTFTETTRIWLGDGDGSFQPQEALTTQFSDSEILDYERLTTDLVVDRVMRRDSLDVVLINRNADVTFLEGDGNGGLSTYFRLGSFPGNNDNQIVYRHYRCGGGAWMFTDGTPNGEYHLFRLHYNPYYRYSKEKVFTSNQRLTKLASGDFNGDGDDELAVIEDLTYRGRGLYDLARVSVFLSGYSAPSASYMLPDWEGDFGPPFAVDMQTADFNGDGALDLAVTGGDSNGFLSILLGNGDGTFADPVHYETGYGPDRMAIADFDQDQDLDIAIPFSYGGQLGIFSNDGQGGFTSGPLLEVPNLPTLTMTADFNRDGAPDIALMTVSLESESYFDYRISMLLNDNDITAPSVRINPAYSRVFPHQDSRFDDPLDSVDLVFSEVISGLRLEDVQLMRDSVVIDISGATLTEVHDGQTWTLSGLTSLTEANGSYRLVLSSQLQDRVGNRLEGERAIAWNRGITADPPAAGDFSGGQMGRAYVGNWRPNWRTGTADNDRLWGMGGSDRLVGRDGHDLLVGGNADDWLSGGKQNDRLYGDKGTDTLIGNTGDDWLLGGQGTDLLIGSFGNDTLEGGLGQDTLWGGPGANVFRYRRLGDGGDLIIGFDPTQDIIDLTLLGHRRNTTPFARFDRYITLTERNGSTQVWFGRDLDRPGVTPHLLTTLRNVAMSELSSENFAVVV